MEEAGYGVRKGKWEWRKQRRRWGGREGVKIGPHSNWRPKEGEGKIGWGWEEPHEGTRGP